MRRLERYAGRVAQFVGLQGIAPPGETGGFSAHGARGPDVAAYEGCTGHDLAPQSANDRARQCVTGQAANDENETHARTS